jgi:hypothetical protein
LHGYPTSFVIDGAGMIVWRRDGMIHANDEELATVIAKARAGA